MSCFFVDAEGNVVQPEIVELSDEIFRAPILNALARSRYQPLPGEQALRPGCRSFLFRLEPLAGDACGGVTRRRTPRGAGGNRDVARVAARPLERFDRVACR